MSLEISRTIKQLREECVEKDIVIQFGKRESKADYVKALRDFYLKERYGSLDNIPWSLKFMLSIDCPMLCKRYDQCSLEQQQRFWNSSCYIAEEKRDGNRCLICFDASTQSFDFYSRSSSVKDYLPISYKDTVYITSNEFHFPHNFVLDSEVISTNPNISTVVGKKGVICETQLQATSALLALNPKESIELQKVDPLKFIIFDCLYDDVSLLDAPWKERHPHAESISYLLKQAGFTCELNPVVRDNKAEFYSDIIESCKEGIVFKNINAPYHATNSRTVDQVKLKRTVSDGLSKDIDAWVTGFVPSTAGKSWSDLIGALVFSCKVKMKDGTVKLHQIGTCSGLPLELRKAATILVDGKPALNPEFLGRVATLTGQNISARKLALTHCVIESWRYDKNVEDCETLTERELRSMIF